MKLVTIPPALQSRSIGTYPISIATSLALEGIFGIHEDIQYSRNDKYPYKRFNHLAINYRTMIRNIIGSVSSQAAVSFTPEILITLIAEEMSIIQNVVTAVSRNSLKVHYYTARYNTKRTQRLLPYARFKEPKTPIQLVTYQLESDTLDILTHLARQESAQGHFPPNAFMNISDDVPTFKEKLDTSKGILYLTHLPLDMLVTPKGRKALLESHTGKVKTEPELASKLRGKPTHVPFDIMTIQMYGDTGMILDPQDMKLRKELNTLGENIGWNATTTESRIKGETKRKGTKELSQLVQQLYSIKVKI